MEKSLFETIETADSYRAVSGFCSTEPSEISPYLLHVDRTNRKHRPPTVTEIHKADQLLEDWLFKFEIRFE